MNEDRQAPNADKFRGAFRDAFQTDPVLVRAATDKTFCRHTAPPHSGEPDESGSSLISSTTFSGSRLCIMEPKEMDSILIPEQVKRPPPKYYCITPLAARLYLMTSPITESFVTGIALNGGNQNSRQIFSEMHSNSFSRAWGKALSLSKGP
jgi:hypothetical protein